MTEKSTNMTEPVDSGNALVSMDYESSQPSDDELPTSQPSTQQSAPAKGSEHDTIDVDQLPEKEEDKGRKEMAARSEWWAHFEKVKIGNVVKAGRCKYCTRVIKAESKGHGTSSLKRHFGACKHNPNKFIKDPTQSTLQATQGEAT